MNKMANICKQAEAHSQTQLLISVFFFFIGCFGGIGRETGTTDSQEMVQKRRGGEKMILQPAASYTRSIFYAHRYQNLIHS